MYNYNQYPKQQQQPVQQYTPTPPIPQGYGWQQQPQTYGWQSAQQTASTGLKGRPVSSFDEARVSIIDFDGSVFYFPDLANGKIYTKQINMDGTATTNIYVLSEMPNEQQSRMTTPADCITRSEFEQAMAQLRNTILSVMPQQEQKKEEIKSFI